MLTGDVEENFRFGQRMAGRVGECLQASARSTRRASFVFQGHQTMDKTTVAQRACLQRISSRVRESGSCPSRMTPKLAFEEVIKSKDMYSLNRCSVVAFDLDKLKITKTDTLQSRRHHYFPPPRQTI